MTTTLYSSYNKVVDDANDINYTPTTGGDWPDPDPTTTQEALDDLASIVNGGGVSGNIITTSSATYTVLDDDYTILCDCSSNDVQVDLPASASSNKRILNVKKIAGNFEVIINPNGSETIDGEPDDKIVVLWNSAMIQCNGTAWFNL